MLGPRAARGCVKNIFFRQDLHNEQDEEKIDYFNIYIKFQLIKAYTTSSKDKNLDDLVNHVKNSLLFWFITHSLLGPQKFDF